MSDSKVLKDFCLEYLILFRVLRYILSLIDLNIAVVMITIYKWIYLLAFTMCDGSDYVAACFLFIH